MAVTAAKWILKDPQSLEIVTLDGSLGVKLASDGGLEKSDQGIRVKDLGITNAMLAGNITDDKLATQYIKADGTRPFTGNQSMNGYRLTNVGNPVDAQDAVNKNYVDSKIGGLSWRDPVERSVQYVKTDAGAPTGTASEDEYCLNTADAKLYHYTGGAWDAGTDVSAGERYLFNEDGTDGSGASGSNTADMKIYEYNGTSFDIFTPEANWALFRKSDDMGLVYDDDTSKWIQFTGTGQITAGQGLYKDGNVINVGQGFGLTVNADNIEVNTSAIISDGLEVDADSKIRISAAAAGDGLGGGSGSALYVKTGDGLTISSDQVTVVASDLAGFGLEADGNDLRISSAAAGDGLTGGSGAPLAVGAGNGINVLSDAVELGTLSSNWDLGGNYTITGVPTPTNDSDVVNKAYVDAVQAGIKNRIVERFTLSDTDVSNKYIMLTNEPYDPLSVMSFIKGAPYQYYGDDFQMDATDTKKLKWDGLGWDGIVESGDKLTVVYYA